jgi:leucyl-tRNA synthetase
LPWDKQFLIESLSDSTIYFAYYTIAHHLQGDLNGSIPGHLDISPQQMTDNEWNAIFLADDSQLDHLKVSKEKILQMREEFEYWYPMDLRCSGKDLIKNHLTMCLFNHAAIFKAEHMPKAFFCNGYVNVDD